MAVLHIFLEAIEGDWYGWIESFPGAFAHAPTREAVLQAAPQAALDYVHWLHAHGEPPPPRLLDVRSSGISIEIAGEHTAYRTPTGSEVNGFFGPDTRAVDAVDIELYLRILNYAHADLEKALHVIAPHEWDSAPFGGKSVRCILHHLADSEQFALSCLGIATTDYDSYDPLARLQAVRAEFVKAVNSLSDGQRGEVTTVDGEKWSLRKVLRRAVWHERYHAAQIAARSDPEAFLEGIVVDMRLRERQGNSWVEV